MAVISPGDNRTILLAIRDRLLEKVADSGNGQVGFTEQNCFICDAPIPEPITEGDVICTVSPTNSQFPENFQVGAGYRQVTEEFGVVVAILLWREIDSVGREDISLADEEYGILGAYKRPILRALLYDDDGQHHWRIKNSQGEDILRDDIRVVSCTQPYRHRIGQQPSNWVLMSLTFSTVFDWDLIG